MKTKFKRRISSARQQQPDDGRIGAEVGRQKYFPFGAPRVQSGTLKTDYRFTGQRSEEANFGSLYDYGASF